jgi:hypothetical protein
MSIRYVSYDIRKGNDYDELRAFIKKYRGKAITESLYRFKTDVELDTFRAELGDAVQGDESVYILIRTKDGIAHGRAATR